MRGQREHDRFELLCTHNGRLRLLSAVDLVSIDERHIVVRADRSSSPGDAFVFRGRPPDDGPRAVRVVGCRPVMDGGQIRYELGLRIVGAEVEAPRHDDAEAGVDR